MSPLSLSSLFSLLSLDQRKHKVAISRTRHSAAKAQREVAEFLEPRALLAGNTPFLIADINPNSANSNPRYLTEVNGTLYFRANNGTIGNELWRVNPNGVAELVADIRPDGSSDPDDFTNVNGVLYFSATTGMTQPGQIGRELYRINSNGGAELVADIRPGTGAESISETANSTILVNVNGTLFFSANNGTNGEELWKINANGGAELAAEIRATNIGSSPRYLTNVNGTLFFAASNGTNGTELWKLNANGGAEMVTDINPNTGSSFPTTLTNLNGTLYFVANNGTSGRELWKVNSSGMAQLVTDINQGVGNSDPKYLTEVNSKVFFMANNGTNGKELWTINSNGSAQLVADINLNAADSYPRELTNVNGTLYFTASNSSTGLELWKINANGAPELVSDIFPGASSSLVRELTNVNGTLYFSADNGDDGFELWKINSNGGAEQVADINSGAAGSYPTRITEVNDKIYFSALTSAHGTELWAVDITESLPAPEIEVVDGRKNLANIKGKVKFKTTSVGTPLTKTLTIRNTGPGTLNLGTITPPAGFSIITPPALSVPTGGTTTFVVQLNATTAGTFTGDITFTTDDADENPFRFSISGKVKAPRGR